MSHTLRVWYVHEMCEKYGWAEVIEDGAPGHKGISRKCREINEVDANPWPPQSPDLNLIEALWGNLECELGLIFGRASDVPELPVDCRFIWHDIIKEVRLESLIKSMPRRLQAVIDAEGAATPHYVVYYYLSPI